jgi:hypothetical protein
MTKVEVIEHAGDVEDVEDPGDVGEFEDLEDFDDFEGMRHWRRAVVWAFTGIFAVALVGGLVANVVGGNGNLNVPATQGGHAAASGARPSQSHAVSRPAAAQAEKALLSLSDLPSGWAKASGPTTDVRSSSWSKPLASCAGVPAAVVRAQPTRVTSPGFTSADKTLAVEDTVSVFGSAAQARAQFAAMANAKTPRCMNSLGSAALASTVQSEAGANATVGTVTITGLKAAQLGRNETGFTVTVPLYSGGRQLTITSTEVDFVSGRLSQQITFNGNGAAFPATLERQLLGSARGRL